MKNIRSAFLQIAGAIPFSSFLKKEGGVKKKNDPPYANEVEKAEYLLSIKHGKSRKKLSKRTNKRTNRKSFKVVKRPSDKTERRTTRRTARKTTRMPSNRTKRKYYKTPKRVARMTVRRAARRTERRTARKTARRTARKTARRTARKIMRRTKNKNLPINPKEICKKHCKSKGNKIFNENSPDGLGYCANCTPDNVVMKGKDGKLWKVTKVKTGKKWVHL